MVSSLLSLQFHHNQLDTPSSYIRFILHISSLSPYIHHFAVSPHNKHPSDNSSSYIVNNLLLPLSNYTCLLYVLRVIQCFHLFLRNLHLFSRFFLPYFILTSWSRLTFKTREKCVTCFNIVSKLANPTGGNWSSYRKTQRACFQLLRAKWLFRVLLYWNIALEIVESPSCARTSVSNYETPEGNTLVSGSD